MNTLVLCCLNALSKIDWNIGKILLPEELWEKIYMNHAHYNMNIWSLILPTLKDEIVYLRYFHLNYSQELDDTLTDMENSDYQMFHKIGYCKIKHVVGCRKDKCRWSRTCDLLYGRQIFI